MCPRRSPGLEYLEIYSFSRNNNRCLFACQFAKRNHRRVSCELTTVYIRSTRGGGRRSTKDSYGQLEDVFLGILCREPSNVIVTTNLPFEQWTEVLGSQRLTGAVLDRLTHHCHILEATGESYRLKDARKRTSGRKKPVKRTTSAK